MGGEDMKLATSGATLPVICINNYG